MSKHTPGPWSYEVHTLSTGLSGIVYGPTGHRIGSAGGTDHLTEEDARLIAAAPEMLEALQELVEFLDDQADAEYFTESAAPVPNDAMRLLVMVRDAIAKAEGRS